MHLSPREGWQGGDPASFAGESESWGISAVDSSDSSLEEGVKILGTWFGGRRCTPPDPTAFCWGSESLEKDRSHLWKVKSFRDKFLGSDLRRCSSAPRCREWNWVPKTAWLSIFYLTDPMILFLMGGFSSGVLAPELLFLHIALPERSCISVQLPFCGYKVRWEP